MAVSTGARHLLVPIVDLAALRAVALNSAELAALTKANHCGGCYLFTREALEPASAAHARFFTPAMNNHEDPATGSAAGPLAAYLQRQQLLPANVETVIEQGDEIGRPSRLQVRLESGRVFVGGTSCMVAEGNILAP